MIARKKVTILPEKIVCTYLLIKNNEGVARACSYTPIALSKVNSCGESLARIPGTYMYQPGAKGLRPDPYNMVPKYL